MNLEIAYADGQLAAMARYKFGFKAIPTVANSAVSSATAKPAGAVDTGVQASRPPTTPWELSNRFDAHESGETRAEPRRKLSAADICTTCRKPKHYGNCSKPRPIPEKAANFNPGMHGSDSSQGNSPSTSGGYHSAVSSVGSLSRAPEGRPADEQAASGFADLFRHQGIRDCADQPGRMYGGLNKTSRAHKLADFMLSGLRGATEKRGPTVHPYHERPPGPVPVTGNNDTGTGRMWRSFDNVTDSTCIDGGAGTPSGEPAA